MIIQTFNQFPSDKCPLCGNELRRAPWKYLFCPDDSEGFDDQGYDEHGYSSHYVLDEEIFLIIDNIMLCCFLEDQGETEIFIDVWHFVHQTRSQAIRVPWFPLDFNDYGKLSNYLQTLINFS